MPTWADLRQFEPKELRTTLAVIEEHHHQLLESPEPAEDQIQRLREILEQTASGEISALAGRLDRQLLHSVADLLVAPLDPDLEEKAVRLGIEAKSTPIVRRAWKLGVMLGPTRGLVRLLRDSLADGLGPALAERDQDQDRLRGWLALDDLPVGLLRDLEDRGETDLYEWLAALPALSTPIESDSQIVRSVRCRLLTHGSRATLQRFHDRLLSWTEELAEAAQAMLREDFAIHYLAEFREGRAWEESTIEWIVDRFDHPDIDSPFGFWRRANEASPGVPQEVASWLALRKLEKFFDEIKDTHGRFEFWRDNFGERFVEVLRLAGGQAVLLRLPGVVVVEFGEIGNAAYVYPDTQLAWLKSRRSSYVSDYKSEDRTERRPSDHTPFRIRHIGSWQYRASREMNDLLRRHGRGKS